MPIYTVENTKTGDNEDVNMSYDDFEKLLAENKHLRRVYKHVMIVDPAGIGVSKPPSDFQKYVLGKVKAANPGSSAVSDKRWSIPKEI